MISFVTTIFSDQTVYICFCGLLIKILHCYWPDKNYQQQGYNLTLVYQLRDKLKELGFKEYRLTSSGSYVNVNSGGNNSKVQVGDIMIFNCKLCQTEDEIKNGKGRPPHVGIVTKIDAKGNICYTARHYVEIDSPYAPTYKHEPQKGVVHSGKTEISILHYDN